MITLLSCCSSPAALISFILIPFPTFAKIRALTFQSVLFHRCKINFCPILVKTSTLLTLDICPVGGPHLVEVSSIPLACHTLHTSAANRLIGEVVQSRRRQAATTAFTFKTLLRHYAKWVLMLTHSK